MNRWKPTTKLIASFCAKILINSNSVVIFCFRNRDAVDFYLLTENNCCSLWSVHNGMIPSASIICIEDLYKRKSQISYQDFFTIVDRKKQKTKEEL